MNKIGSSIVAALALIGMLAAGVSGCKKEGPMERTGREMDKAVEKSGQKIDNAVHKAGESMEKAGEKIKDSAK